jgi:predicted TPR repeat methyltransferase
MGIRKKIHERVLNANNTEELMSAYRDWAGHYDNDLLGEMRYVAPKIASDLLLSHLNNGDSTILDAGCGTGIVGELIHKNGYTQIDGLDYSSDMLEIASEKDIYDKLIQGNLMERLDIEDDAYEAVISVGTFTSGHVGPNALDELIRVAKPGGLICFTVREEAWKKEAYQSKVNECVNKGAWEIINIETADYIQQEGSNCMVCLCRILS